jgi:hypothetical protein
MSDKLTGEDKTMAEYASHAIDRTIRRTVDCCISQNPSRFFLL